MVVRTALVFVLAWSASASARAPVVNEFVSKPGAEEGEWIEVLNPGPDPVDLGGWQIADATGTLRVVGGSVPLAPGALVLLAARPESLRVHYGLADSVTAIRPSGWPILNDRNGSGGAPADVIVLVDPGGSLADSVAYFETWLPEKAGTSLERVDPALPGSGSGAWGWSLDPSGATPGRPNSLRAEPGDGDRGCLEGPRVVEPAHAPAVFDYRLPAPGVLAVWLLDRSGTEVAVLRAPGATGAQGRWSWGPAEPRAPATGLYILCLRWQGEGGRPVRCCRSVWIRT